jgi:predicted O-methyltransferase YrrM
MKPILTATRIVGNYWNQPAMWPSIWRTMQTVLDQKLRPGFAAEQRRKAEEWCAAKAITIEALPGRLPFALELEDPRSEFPEEFKAADARVAECPFKLGGAGNLGLLYSLAKAIKAERVLETGVAYGWSSLALLLAAKDFKAAKLVSIDLPYPWIGNDKWVGIAVPQALRSHWELLRMGDREALPRALRTLGTIDLAHYDSDKSVPGRLYAYGRIWDALRPGGVFISDDIGDNGAFRDFCLSIGREPIIIARDNKYQGILVK